jgi:ubiquinone biosynthesis protein COQ9
MKDTLLNAALAEAPFEGWTQSMLSRAAARIGITEFDVKRSFPGGVSDCLDYFAARTDAEMLEILQRDYDLPSLKIRARIATAVMVRLRLMTPHREAIRRATAYYLLPLHMADGLRVLWRTVDAMWRAAGDTATDYNHYTKRTLLAGVYQSTLTVWLNDSTADLAETESFLHRRIENVMQIEKLKAKAKERFAF